MAEARIDRIDQSNLRESAYRALHDAFTRGEFAPGDAVSLRSLADQLGISMTPVREAVRRLVAEGALVDTPSRTLLVPPYDARRMADLKAARLALESLVLDQAMERIGPADLAALREILEDPGAPGRSKPDLEQNYRFHFAIYRRSGSEVLLPLVEALWLQYGAYLNLVIRQESARQFDEHKHHDEIVAALERGDREAAKVALVRDIERSFRVLGSDEYAVRSSQEGDAP
ncbi:transcriptional regulator, GntR family [Cribrihabitans marinus]|uniref:Transcriptional regulator, GntR family n=1 Tax=Cribrihabitans marinus TaxID=1227549 RepID=A0A1H6Z4Q3_9RHOB|nr:GntR family transcriptional regulator [Cribrihabitans marinus]GGH31329.1 GntR family transcriptional regulator [Cribrihabitans marinus]SEJ48499.1 transcriptional regulator, GntR family [Cribrihabitans marinus]